VRSSCRRGFTEWSEIWQAFACEFPGTARELSRIRDEPDMVVDEHAGNDVNGRRYRTQTRWGQRRLSRILSRVESQIFPQRALVRLFHEHGIRAVPIHDRLMVAERHAEVVKRVIERAAAEVLGFVPVVKIVLACIMTDFTRILSVKEQNDPSAAGELFLAQR